MAENVNSMVRRACCSTGEFDATLYLALRDRLTFGELLDILEMQESAADWREAHRAYLKEEAKRGQ